MRSEPSCSRSLALVAVVLVSLVCAGTVATGPTGAQEVEGPEEEAGPAIERTLLVSEDGDLSRMKVSLVVGQSSYNFYESAAEEEGYDNASHNFAATLVAENDEILGYTEYAVTSRGEDRYGLEVVLDEFDLRKAENLTVSRDDSSVSVELRNQGDVVEESHSSYNTTVVMPGEITDSNAGSVEGDTATWRLHEENPGTLTVESTGGNNGSDSDGGLGPGFGVFTSLGALVAAVLLVVRRDR